MIIGWWRALSRRKFREWDIVLSCIPELVDHFRQRHNIFQLGSIFESRILKKLNDAQQLGSTFIHRFGAETGQFHLEGREFWCRCSGRP